MIRLEGIVKRYGANTALGPIDLTVQRGQTVALIGPSGCGKSTLLRVLLGLVKADSGTIHFDGKPLGPNDRDPSHLARSRERIGYLVQNGGLFPHLSGRTNVTIMARQLGRSNKDIETRLGELMELTELPADVLQRFPHQLSGGQCQRISLMRALMLDPDVMLLDEPLGALGPLVRSRLQEDLRAIFEKLKKTVVVVTHDLAEAAFLSDDIVLLRTGQIVQRGPIQALMSQPESEFVREFVYAQRGLQVEL